MKKVIVTILFIAPFCKPNLAQNIENDSFRLQDENIIVIYDLAGADRAVIVELYSSHDNYAKPLKQVSGAVGDEQRPGTSKTIEWKAKEELGNFKGSIKLKLTARYAPFLELDDSSILQSYRRGKTYPVNFETNTDGPIKWSIDKGRTEFASGSWQAGASRFDIEIPQKLKTGKDYRMVVIGSDLRDVSSQISIKAKIPMAIKVVPIVIAGAVVALIPQSGIEDPQEQGIPDPFLPDN